MSLPSTFNPFTGGLSNTSSTPTSLLDGGAPSTINPTYPVNQSEKQGAYTLDSLGLSPQQHSDLTSIYTLKNPQGVSVVPDHDGFVALGDGYKIGFDPNTKQGQIIPALNPVDYNDANSVTYTGADVRLMIESAIQSPDGRRYAKQLLEATTISVSVHRELAPVRAAGYINPKGFAIGRRTIAGTLIATQFTADALMSFFQSVMQIDLSKDTTFSKADQLPPFNITMLFTNENGYASQRTLYGVKFVTDGVVYSIQDMMIEQTLSFMATDFSPLVPTTLTNLYVPSNQLNQQTRREKSPMDLMDQPA